MQNLNLNRFALDTLTLPSDKNKNDLEIDDTFFRQYYKQVQNLADSKAASNLNYKRIFIINHYHKNTFVTFNESELPLAFRTIDYKLSFSLIFFQKVILITNEDNYFKLILNLFNLINL